MIAENSTPMAWTSSLTLTETDFAFFFFQAEDGIRDVAVTRVQTCALPICRTRQPGPVRRVRPRPAHRRRTRPRLGLGTTHHRRKGRLVGLHPTRLTGGGSYCAPVAPAKIGRASCRARAAVRAAD